MHTSTSTLEAPSINNMNDSDLDSNRQNSSVYSDDGKEAETPQPSRYRMCRELFSYEGGDITEPEEYSTNMLRGISAYAASGDEPSSLPEPEPLYSKFRQSGPDLITLHMFTGRTKGETPIYVPVYKRNDFGQLLKLVRRSTGPSGRWEYVELRKLSEEEIEAGLKLWEDPKPEKVSKTPETKKAVGRRTLAALGLPETQSKGG